MDSIVESDQSDVIKQINQLVKQNKPQNIRKIRSLISQIDQGNFILPYIKPLNLGVSKNVALVGNSRSLLNNLFGQQIDQHDEVIRFNWAITKGFEKYAGSKETIRATAKVCLRGKRHKNHPTGLIPNYKIYRDFRHLNFVVYDGNMSIPQAKLKTIARENKIDTKSNKFYGIKWDLTLFNQILKQLAVPFQLLKLPQVGLGMTLICCSLGLNVNLYGFDISKCDYNYGYYWSTIKHKQLSPYHNISIEHQILLFMEKHQQITISK